MHIFHSIVEGGGQRMLQLQQFTPQDFTTLISWIDSELFMFQWGGPAFTYPLTIEQLLQYSEHANYDGASTYIFKAVDSVTEQVVGHVSIGRINYNERCGRIGKVLIAEPFRGRGYGKALIEETVRYAFSELQLQKVTLGVFDFNEAAIACYEKVGFLQERYIQNARKFGEDYWHLREMSLYKSSYIMKVGNV